MFEFYVYETVSIPITIKPEGALTDYKSMVLSFGQGDETLINLTEDDLQIDVETDTITAHLSQTQTAMFTAGSVKMQFNIYYQDAERDTSGTATLKALPNMYRKVMS